jgi:hypothetical protein
MTSKLARTHHRLWLGLISRCRHSLPISAVSLVRLPLLLAALQVSACSTYFGLPSNGDLPIERRSSPTPTVDLSGVKWLRLVREQPVSHPVRMAVITRDEKIGATRVVLKIPANFTMPPFWLTNQGTYTVLQGTFVFEGVDARGAPLPLTQKPGDFNTIPANLIQKASTKDGDEGILYITVYGEWDPKFPAGVWGKPLLRGAR